MSRKHLIPWECFITRHASGLVEQCGCFPSDVDSQGPDELLKRFAEHSDEARRGDKLPVLKPVPAFEAKTSLVSFSVSSDGITPIGPSVELDILRVPDRKETSERHLGGLPTLDEWKKRRP